MADNCRLIVAQLVAEKKPILFNALSPVLTRRDKENAWEAIRQAAIAGGCKNLAEKDWKYIRDGVWGPARRDAVKKYDISQKSGEGAVRFSQVDKVILDIVGRDSSVVKGLDVKDTEEDFFEKSFEDFGPAEKSGLGRQEIEVLSPKGECSSSGGRSIFATTFRSPRQFQRRSPSGKRSSSSESDQIDAEIKRNKLLLVKEQLRGQKLANEKMELEIEEMRSRRSSGSSLAGLASESLRLRSQSDLQPIFRTQDEQFEWERTRQMEDEELSRF